MRIGFDVTVLSIAQAGVFYYNYNLIRALLEHDRQNEYLFLDYEPFHENLAVNPPEAYDLEAPNARVVHCQGLAERRLARWEALQKPAPRAAANLVDQTLLWPWTAAAEAVMERQLTHVLEGLDVFHSSDVLLWRQPGALNVLTVHDLTILLFPEWHTPMNRDLHKRVHRFVQEKADVVIAVSECTRRDIIEQLNVPAERVHVVYEGVDSRFGPLDREALAWPLASLGVVSGDYILFLGTIEPRKNLARLVEAYALVRKMAPPPLPRLVVAGAPGWQFQDVFERVEALDLQEHVVFLGRVPGELIPALYNGAQLFVYPSLYEGFGLPVLEAMACGTPVVTSNVSSLPEVAGDAAVLVDPTDVEALAQALRDVLGDAGRRAALRAAGLARARQFTWERAARETLALYRAGVDQVRAGQAASG